MEICKESSVSLCHTHGALHPCYECQTACDGRSSRQKENKSYTCDQCNISFTRSANLRMHKEAKHQGIRYSCSQCEFLASERSQLRKHVKVKHEGVRYPCDKCDYKATRKQHLKQHKESKHDGKIQAEAVYKIRIV